MMGIRHGRAWLYSCPGTIRVNLGHCAPLLSYPPVFSSQTPKNPSQIKKKKKAVAACLAGPHLNCYKHLHTGGAI